MNLTFDEEAKYGKLLEYFINSGVEMTHKSVVEYTEWKPWKAHAELSKLKTMGIIRMVSEKRGTTEQRVHYEISNLENLKNSGIISSA